MFEKYDEMAMKAGEKAASEKMSELKNTSIVARGIAYMVAYVDNRTALARDLKKIGFHKGTWRKQLLKHIDLAFGSHPHSILVAEAYCKAYADTFNWLASQEIVSVRSHVTFDRT